MGRKYTSRGFHTGLELEVMASANKIQTVEELRRTPFGKETLESQGRDVNEAKRRPSLSKRPFCRLGWRRDHIR